MDRINLTEDDNMADTAANVLDLDSLVPQPAQVKIGNQIVDVNPPSVVDMMRLGQLGGQLQNVASLSDADIEATMDKLKALIIKCIPELADHPLNMAQLLKLTELISELAMPGEATELAKRGITAAPSKKAE
jgi:hypothetical protein